MTRALATCHPDQPVHGHGLCRPCYREKRRAARAEARSQTTTAAAPDPQSSAKASSRRSSAKERMQTQPPATTDASFGEPRPAPKPSQKGKAKPAAPVRNRPSTSRTSQPAPAAPPEIATVEAGDGHDEAEALDTVTTALVVAAQAPSFQAAPAS